MYKRILVGFDGSELSKRAFDVALRRAVADGAELFVLAVAHRHFIADEVESRAVLDRSIEYYRDALASLREATLAAGAKASFDVVVGNTADQLIRGADRYGVNLIVVGEHGSRFRQRLFGSVAKELARYPRCPPVLAVQ
jgi:nucleotide-binding universal stress UspA family protein